ncbi:hypothetical protein B0J11DRAFT_502744 [Dendryphion nanum]|uniref:Phosphoglycerate mutase n=1 Tax=Dendryphion nanum TaxID=256645 RepID=A0A9P9ECQ5_9PLEO|nr:hypothetical protein B0J11DRAFT_502744 [Dendryphion nanum]
MAKGPAVVIIARHGARLDAADKTWHLTSPTPYDPPLTYGGWSQAKSLGLRIASILHEREKEAEGERRLNSVNADLAHLDFSSLDAGKGNKNALANGLPAPKRRHKIVIHSSPFLRCIQTSTAIAAGISQFQPPSAPNLRVPHPIADRMGLKSHSPLSRTYSNPSPAVQPVVHQSVADPKLEVFQKKHVGPEKILLRIDAFLGEWLSPDYYEDITPPPNSTMMVASAKADLLRRGEYIEVQQVAPAALQGHFPGGWVKGNASPAINGRKMNQDTSSPTLGSLAQVLPHRERSSSQGSASSLSSRGSHKGTSTLTTAHKVPEHIYDPPVPAYAVSPADPIPRGYTAHARDACIDVDFQWDSMRAPQGWGDGGEYGDEWSTMHKRFRKGIGGMMTWYKDHGFVGPQEKIRGFTYRENGHALFHHASEPGPSVDSRNTDTVDDDEDLVVIMVTHGAGCNALLGAITNQPVLLDVGVASLSMAVRREEPRKPSVSSPPLRRPSVIDIGMSNEYEMKMMASTDHLRPGVDPSRSPLPQSAQSPAGVSSPSLEYRRRFTSSVASNSPVESPFTIGQPWANVNSSLGSIRRSSTSGSSSKFYTNNSSGSASPSLGLWSSLKASTLQESSDGRQSPGHDMVLNFAEHKSAKTPNGNDNGTKVSKSGPASNGEIKADEKHDEDDDLGPLPKVPTRGTTQGAAASPLWKPKGSNSPGGLWGPPRFDDINERDKGHKRRWTVTEADASLAGV